MDRNQLLVIQFVSHTLSYLNCSLCRSIVAHLASFVQTVSIGIHMYIELWSQTYLLITFSACLHWPIIAAFARFPDSFLCFIPLLSSGITRFVVGKSLLMMCNSSLVQFLKKHVSLTMSFLSLICQDGNTCLFKSIMFCSCCLVIAFDINTVKYIEIMIFWIFSKSLHCL